MDAATNEVAVDLGTNDIFVERTLQDGEYRVFLSPDTKTNFDITGTETGTHFLNLARQSRPNLPKGGRFTLVFCGLHRPL